jgi:rubredoxin
MHPTEDQIERCGHDTDPGDRVCPECGAPLWSQEDYDSVDEEPS